MAYLQPLAEAKEALSKGKPIAFPTDTVYGLGVSYALDPYAEQLFSLKRRDKAKSVAIYVSDREEVEFFSKQKLSADTVRLIEAFMPGPITLIIDHANPLFSQKRLGFRMIPHPVVQELLATAGPILATSANISGKPSAVTPADVLDDFSSEDIGIIPGECSYGLESTVISVEPLQIYREGILSKEDIEKVLMRDIPVVASTPAFLQHVRIHVVANEDLLEEFLCAHPDFQGVICKSPMPQTFFPSLRKAFRSIPAEIVFVYNPQDSLYPELRSYLSR